MEVTAYTATGEAREKAVSLPASVFDGKVHRTALHQAVTAVLAHRRQGTASTKTRNDVRGGGRKPWRQKGTGRARAGTIRSPLWRGGAVVFGPEPRAYAVRLPKKVRQLAIRSALNARALEGNLAVFDPPELESPRTRTVADWLRAIGAADRNVLMLTDGIRRHLYLSSRNLPRVEVRPWGEVSAYDVLRAELVLVERSALEESARPAVAGARAAEDVNAPPSAGPAEGEED